MLRLGLWPQRQHLKHCPRCHRASTRRSLASLQHGSKKWTIHISHFLEQVLCAIQNVDRWLLLFPAEPCSMPHAKWDLIGSYLKAPSRGYLASRMGGYLEDLICGQTGGANTPGCVSNSGAMTFPTQQMQLPNLRQRQLRLLHWPEGPKRSMRRLCWRERVAATAVQHQITSSRFIIF